MILEDRAGEAFLLVMHIQPNPQLSSSFWPYRFLYVITYQKIHYFMKFFTKHQTMEKPHLTARQVEAQPHFSVKA